MDENHSTALNRMMVGLGCSAASGLTGFILPCLSYRLWREFVVVGGGAQDWSGLMAYVMAMMGGIGGAISGLCAGAVWPQQNPLARALAGLCGLMTIAGLYSVLYL